MSRPEAPAEVAAELQYDPPPTLVHVDYFEPFLTSEIRGAIHGAGAKIYANAFVVADLQAAADGGLEGYPDMFEGGLDVVQTEFPHWALTALGRLEPRH